MDPQSKLTDDFLKRFSQALGQFAQGSNAQSAIMASGKELFFYGIDESDKEIWNELIRYGDDKSIYNALKAKKSYLLTHVIGNPNDLRAKLMRHDEVHYGNILLHNRMINSHDESVLKPDLSPDQRVLLTSNQKGSDYLLRYYELKKVNASKDQEKLPDKAQQQLAEIKQAILAKDIEGKTPLLLACKNCNQDYALRLIALDDNRETLNLQDSIEKRTPLHIACLLGLTKLVQRLLELEVNTDILDYEGHDAFYYLTISTEQKKHYIKQVLDSVNFFYGRYFRPENEDRIITEILKQNEELKQALNDKIKLHQVADGKKKFSKK